MRQHKDDLHVNVIPMSSRRRRTRRENARLRAEEADRLVLEAIERQQRAELAEAERRAEREQRGRLALIGTVFVAGIVALGYAIVCGVVAYRVGSW